MSNILSLLAPLLICFIFFILYNYLIRPYITLQIYKKQGAATHFYPGLLSYPTFYKEMLQKGDFYSHYKELEKSNPNLKFIAENFGSRCFVILLDVNMIKEMLQRHEIYPKDEFFYGVAKRLARGSVVVAEGDEWKKGRRLISGAFNFGFLKHMIPMIIEITQDKFSELIARNQLKDLEIIYPLAEITGNITGRFFFGKKFGEYKMNGESLTAVVHRLLAEVATEAFSPLFLLFGPRLSALNLFPRHRRMNRDIQNFRECCREIIQEIEKSSERGNNLLSVLLDHRKHNENEDGLTDDQIIGEFLGLFSAGTETTSDLINSTIYFLCKNPDVLQKVKEEIDREFTDLESLTIENVNRMEYMAAVFKESLRLGGPIDGVMFRSAVKDDVICGVKIKKGTLINMCHAVQYTSEKYYKDPNNFRPERWLPGSGSQDPVKSEPYGFVPFSAGPRNCIGQHLAFIEAKIITAMFVKRFDFSIPKDYNMILVPKFTYIPLEPVKVTLVPK